MKTLICDKCRKSDTSVVTYDINFTFTRHGVLQLWNKYPYPTVELCQGCYESAATEIAEIIKGVLSV